MDTEVAVHRRSNGRSHYRGSCCCRDTRVPVKIIIVVILAVVGYVDGGGCIEMVMVVVVDVLRLSK